MGSPLARDARVRGLLLPPHLFIYSLHPCATITLAYAPTRTRVLALTALAGLAMPALTGIVDLSLRARIP
ncbi:MAG TPA: hypothetical protein VGS01_03560 [Candidatus Limnocylindria bacterium]|nr:hypothetical protein [Candidatus Limnocylindria bacterium]